MRHDRPVAQTSAVVSFGANPTKRSVLPRARHATKGVALDRDMADGRERQVRGHQRLAVRRQLPQQTDPDADRLLGVMFEAVEPVGVVEPDLEDGVAGATSYSFSNVRSWLRNSFKNRLPVLRSASGNPGGM